MKKTILSLLLFIALQIPLFAQYNWGPVGLGTNLTVQSLAVDTNNNVLYAGGIFTLAGGSTALNVAKWDGSNYSSLGPGVISGTGVYSMLVLPSGDLVAGGTFTNIGGTLVKNVAKWNGATWAPLGLGLDSTSAVVVKALAMYNNELYAGGIFNNSGGTLVSFIAKWNGTNWLPLGSGTNGIVRSLCVYNGELYAGGTFTNAGGVSVNNIAKWNGTSWSDVGGGVNYTGAISVSALQVYTGGLYAGGTFTTAGSTAVHHIAKWDGLSWTDPGGGATNYTGAISVSALQIYKGDLVAGGTFDSLGTASAKYIGKWNGTAWSNMGSGMNNSVYALAVMKDTLYAGGVFTISGGVNTTFISQWSPTMLSAMYMGDYNASDAFMLFPNPAAKDLHIRSRSTGFDNAVFNFVLTDPLGREISKINNGRHEIILERKDISAGVYFYKITDRNNVLLQEGKILFAD